MEDPYEDEDYYTDHEGWGDILDVFFIDYDSDRE